MLTTFLVTVGGLIGSAGGLWIAALFYPPLLLLLKSSIDFLKSPVGQGVAVTVIVLALFVGGWIGGDVHGTSTTKADWRAADAAREAAEIEREHKLAADMAAHAGVAIATDDAFTKSIDQQVQNHDAENADASACRRATGADIGRLLSIR